MASASTTVFIVCQPFDALASAFTSATKLRLAGAAPSTRDATAALKDLRPAVTLVDLDLRENVVGAMPTLQAAAPESRIIALTDVTDPIRHAGALYGGARGLIQKQQVAELLPRAVPKILAGELWFERQLVAAALLATLAAKRRVEEQGERRAWLAPRRRDMLALAGEGLSDQEIAARLALSAGVVRTQIEALTQKLGLASRLELVAYAHQAGVMPGPRLVA